MRKQNPSDVSLLAMGVALELVPLVFVVVFPEHFGRAEFFLRVIASLGAGLVGAAIPGLLQIRIPGVRAAGAMALIVLIFLFNPPQRLVQALNPPTVTLKATVLGTRCKVDAERRDCPTRESDSGLRVNQAEPTTPGRYYVEYSSPFVVRPQVSVEVEGPAADQVRWHFDNSSGAGTIIEFRNTASDGLQPVSFVLTVSGARAH